jgi:hypothetical protein
VGTLSCYVRHRDDAARETVYALTCRHVVDPLCALGTEPYVAVEGSGHHNHRMNSPAAGDHETTMWKITADLDEHWQAPIDAEAYRRENTTLAQVLEKARQYNIDLGYVYATSGVGRLLPHCLGRSDWAIIAITNPAIPAENKVCNSRPDNLVISTLAKTSSTSAHRVGWVLFGRSTTDQFLHSTMILYAPRGSTSPQARILSLFETVT